MIIGSLFNALAGAAAHMADGMLTVLVFHRVTAVQDALFPEEMYAHRFDTLLGRLKRYWKIVPLGQAVDCLRAGTLRSPCMAITFDDGYADNFLIAAPILRKHRVAATIFVASGYLGGGCMWNDKVIEAVRSTRHRRLQFSFLENRDLVADTNEQRRAVIDKVLGTIKHWNTERRAEACEEVARVCAVVPPNDLMMSPEQIQALPEMGIAIGAHTVTHPILASLGDDVAAWEIAQGKTDLEILLGQTVDLFAYPNGKPLRDYLPKHVEMVKAAGFRAAFSTSWGAGGSRSGIYDLPRFTPWDASITAFNFRLLRNLFVEQECAASGYVGSRWE